MVDIEIIKQETANHFKIDIKDIYFKKTQSTAKHDYDYCAIVFVNACKMINPKLSAGQIASSIIRNASTVKKYINDHISRVDINNRPGFEKYNIARSECRDINTIIHRVNKRIGTNIIKYDYKFISYSKPKKQIMI